MFVFAFAGGGAQPAFARGGGGPPGWTMTLNYCRETVTNKGITDVTKFEQEVKKCFANPVTYPPAYGKRRGSGRSPPSALLKGLDRPSPI
jgi:hypothetical protein